MALSSLAIINHLKIHRKEDIEAYELLIENLLKQVPELDASNEVKCHLNHLITHLLFANDKQEVIDYKSALDKALNAAKLKGQEAAITLKESLDELTEKRLAILPNQSNWKLELFGLFIITPIAITLGIVNILLPPAVLFSFLLSSALIASNVLQNFFSVLNFTYEIGLSGKNHPAFTSDEREWVEKQLNQSLTSIRPKPLPSNTFKQMVIDPIADFSAWFASRKSYPWIGALAFTGFSLCIVEFALLFVAAPPIIPIVVGLTSVGIGMVLLGFVVNKCVHSALKKPTRDFDINQALREMNVEHSSSNKQIPQTPGLIKKTSNTLSNASQLGIRYVKEKFYNVKQSCNKATSKVLVKVTNSKQQVSGKLSNGKKVVKTALNQVKNYFHFRR